MNDMNDNLPLYIWFGFGFLTGLVKTIETWIKSPPQKCEWASIILCSFSASLFLSLCGFAAPILTLWAEEEAKKRKEKKNMSYLTFKEVLPRNGKPIWEVRNKNNQWLGSIEWKINNFVFTPHFKLVSDDIFSFSVFSHECLDEISAFLKKLEEKT